MKEMNLKLVLRAASVLAVAILVSMFSACQSDTADEATSTDSTEQDTSSEIENDGTDSTSDSDTGDSDSGNSDCFVGELNITSSTMMASYSDITCVDGDLFIDSLDVAALNFPNLTTVSGTMGIFNNTNLVNLDGLGSLEEVGGMEIEDNLQLVSISGLSNLTTIGSNKIQIESNDSLTSLTGLEGITQISDRLLISKMPGLLDMTGLNNLESVGRLSISWCANLSTLQGLEKLNSADELSLWSNAALDDVSALSALTTIADDLTIEENSELLQCDACGIMNGLSNFQGTYSFYGNKSDTCNDYLFVGAFASSEHHLPRLGLKFCSK